MAKLYFHYASMAAGKSAYLLQANHNYVSGGQETLLYAPRIDTRSGPGVIRSRIGLEAPCRPFDEATRFDKEIAHEAVRKRLACVFVDEAQFLAPGQVRDLARVVDHLGVPVMAFGLRTDFRGELFAGSEALFRFANEIREIISVCHCGTKAIMTARVVDGKIVTEGEQVAIEGEVSYRSLCRRHWEEATGL